MKKIFKRIGIVFLVLIVLSALSNALRGTDKTKSERQEGTDSTAGKTESQIDADAGTSEPEKKIRQQRNGFDETTNHTYEFEGFAFSIPSYMTETEIENGVAFSINGESNDSAQISLLRVKVTYSAEVFEQNKKEYINKMTEKNNFSWQKTSDVTVAGCPGIVGSYQENNDEGQGEIDAYLWYDAHNSALFGLTFIEAKGASYSYIDDVKKMVASAMYTGNGITDSAAEPKEEDKEVENAENAAANENVPSGVTPDFKAQMDKYEAFFDEYVEFMKKYSESDDPVALMSEYLDFLQKYNEYMEALNAIDESRLSDADALYFAEVNLRIEKKLLEVISS